MTVVVSLDTVCMYNLSATLFYNVSRAPLSAQSRSRFLLSRNVGYHSQVVIISGRTGLVSGSVSRRLNHTYNCTHAGSGMGPEAIILLGPPPCTFANVTWPLIDERTLVD